MEGRYLVVGRDMRYVFTRGKLSFFGDVGGRRSRHPLYITEQRALDTYKYLAFAYQSRIMLYVLGL